MNNNINDPLMRDMVDDYWSQSTAERVLHIMRDEWLAPRAELAKEEGDDRLYGMIMGEIDRRGLSV